MNSHQLLKYIAIIGISIVSVTMLDNLIRPGCKTLAAKQLIEQESNMPHPGLCAQAFPDPKYPTDHHGLSKVEYIAAMLMRPNDGSYTGNTSNDARGCREAVAREAVLSAIALLNEIEKAENPPQMKGPYE
jgi:hypothetical protein